MNVSSLDASIVVMPSPSPGMSVFDEHRRTNRLPRPARVTRVASAVLGVLEVEAAAGVPRGALVAVRWYAAGVADHPGEVQEVPRHERRVPVGEVVGGTAGALVQVRRAGPGLTDPSRIRLRRDDVAE